MAKAVAYMYPFILDKKKWPLKPDVMYFDQWPVRQPSLLFAGLALDQAGVSGALAQAGWRPHGGRSAAQLAGAAAAALGVADPFQAAWRRAFSGRKSRNARLVTSVRSR